MKVITVVENRGGMLFNRRRVSKDSTLCARILTIAAGGRLWMSAYSAKLFPGASVCVDENFLDKAGDGEYCFVESPPLAPYRDRIEEMILCKWNRDYPSDAKLDLMPQEAGMACVGTEEFAGASHEKITIERWKRK